MTYVYGVVELIWDRNLVMQQNFIIRVLVCHIFIFISNLQSEKNNSTFKSYLSGLLATCPDLAHVKLTKIQAYMSGQHTKPN